MKEIKKIELVLENCEVIKIPIKFVGYIALDGIKTKIERMASNFVGKINIANEIILCINKRFKKIKYYPFGKENFPNPEDPFKRIATYNDITSINIFYDDNTMESYCVEYEEEVEGQLGTPNVNQDTYISKKGNIMIKVSKKTLKDYLTENEFDSMDEMVDILSHDSIN